MVSGWLAVVCFGVSVSPQGVHEKHRPVAEKMGGGGKKRRSL